ncbi:MAG: hypothetical protein ABI947_18820 [Chloroflexota bacterium]
MAHDDNMFAELLLGVALYIERPTGWESGYPPGLLHAMSNIALGMGTAFPKTFSAFLTLCHKSLVDWYPYPLADFTTDYPLMNDGQLGEQAKDYLYSLPDELLQKHHKTGFLPASVLDNWEIVRFLDRMHSMDDAVEAQRLYVIIRSFLIEHSWITSKDLIALKQQNVTEESRDYLKTTFYQQDDSGDEIYCCDYCGILHITDGQLAGIKPIWCDDHHPSLPYIQTISASSYSRMKPGIHLRTFIPGQAERVVFAEAEALQDEHPEHLTAVVRYPGLDAYDLRLKFRDEAWAVDVKDLADPKDLARKIRPMAQGNVLEHAKEFYVVPDRRLRFVPDYMEQVHRHYGAIKPPLYLLTQEDFCTRMRSKCAELIKASR